MSIGRKSIGIYLLVSTEPPAAPHSLRAAGRGARWAGAAWRGPPPPRAQYRALLAAPRPADGAPAAPHELLNLTLDDVFDDG